MQVLMIEHASLIVYVLGAFGGVQGPTLVIVVAVLLLMMYVTAVVAPVPPVREMKRPRRSSTVQFAVESVSVPRVIGAATTGSEPTRSRCSGCSASRRPRPLTTDSPSRR